MTYDEFIKMKQWVQPKKNYQKHHIIPRCKGGTNEIWNVVRLSYVDHYIAHKLLAEENPNDEQIQHGFNSMGTLESYLNKCLKLTESHPEKYTEAVKESMRKPKKALETQDPTLRLQHRLLQSINHAGGGNTTGDNVSPTLSLEEKINRFYKNEEKKQRRKLRAEHKEEYTKWKIDIENQLKQIADNRSKYEALLSDNPTAADKIKYRAEIQNLIAQKQKLNQLKRDVSLNDYLVQHGYLEIKEEE